VFISMKNKIKYRLGSENIFADIGVPDAEGALAKADLARRVIGAIREKGNTQEEAASILGIAQPKISDLMRGRLTGFSMERLMRFLVRLGKDVQVVIKEPIRARRDVRIFGGAASEVLPLIISSSCAMPVFYVPASRASGFGVGSEGSPAGSASVDSAPWNTVAPYVADIAPSASVAAFMED
jgi:predicted XRE-type DNA-binding protein